MTRRALLTASIVPASMLAGGSLTHVTAATRTRATTIATVADYTWTGRAWAFALRRRLPETGFWKTVTAPRAPCRFDISTRASGNAAHGQLIARLVRSPALGRGRTFTFGLTGR
jgi:hypothetical protein